MRLTLHFEQARLNWAAPSTESCNLSIYGKHHPVDVLTPYQFSVPIENPMRNLFPEFLAKFNSGLRSAYLQFDSVARDMNEAHYAILAIVVIGVGVVLMRGKPVKGS